MPRTLVGEITEYKPVRARVDRLLHLCKARTYLDPVAELRFHFCPLPRLATIRGMVAMDARTPSAKEKKKVEGFQTRQDEGWA